MNINITGFGILSAIGNNADQCLHNLQKGSTGIDFDSKRNLMLGQIKLTDEEIIHQLELPNKNYSRTTLLGILAAKEAWGDNKHLDSVRTGIISGTSVGGIDRSEEYFMKSLTEETDKYYADLTYDNGRETENIARYLGISGYIDTVATACSSGANAILIGAELIRNNILDRVLVGSVDPFSQYTIRGFSSLGIYDNEICKPYDEKRNGLNLGEGAAFLVLESDKSIGETKNKSVCKLVGWNNSSDAFHQTASSSDGRGAADAMNKALAKANLSKSEIDYINVHGTGTSNNDLSESHALLSVFGNEIPPLSSTKGFTGHTLAAAGSVEAVFSIMALLNQFYPISLNFLTPIEETGLKPISEINKRGKIKNVLSNSFGFGGNCSSLIFQKV